MSLSAIRGALGLAIQSAKGVAEDNDANYIYIPTLNANAMGEQIAQPLPPEVGGTYFSRGSYKTALRARGEIALIPRVNSLGYLLRSIFNGEAVTANAATGLDGSGATVNRNLHRFISRDDLDPIWLSARRYVADAWGEQLTDCRLGMFRLEIAASNVANAAVQMLGRDCVEIPGIDANAEDGAVFYNGPRNLDSDEGGDRVDYRHENGLHIGLQSSSRPRTAQRGEEPLAARRRIQDPPQRPARLAHRSGQQPGLAL